MTRTFFLMVSLAASPLLSQTRLKVYISADMEGVVGVVTGDQLGPTGFEYGRFREFMTSEVVAAIEGARDAGATDFVVSDSHGNGENLLIEKLPREVELVRSWPRPLGMMEGIDGSFAAAIFIGYHASTTNSAGVRAHTISSANYAELKLNGIAAPEALLNAAVAGHFRVPVAMISGDDAIVAEARQLLGNIEGAVVKKALSFHAAQSLTPEASYALIRETARRAVSRAKEMKPYVLPPPATPITLDLTFKNYRPSEILAYLPIVERTTSHAIRFRGKDILEVSRFLQFVGGYEPGLTP